MAIQANINFSGLIVPTAYVRIDRIFGGKREGWNALVSIYADSAHAADGVTPALEQFNCATAYDKKNADPYALVYAEIAKLPRFVGGIAV